MVKIYTAQYRYSGPGKLDITAKGNDPLGKFFAPTWELIKSLKNGTINERQYEIEYCDLMLHSWNTYQNRWQELLSRQEVTLVCFCPPGTFCHRLLLAGYLEKVGAIHIGEKNLKGGFPGHDKQMSILDAKHGIICHQVNCRGVMGAGLAKAIRDKWPIVYEQYRKAYEQVQLRVGKLHIVPVDNHNLLVANLCGQNKYGRDKRYTDYLGLRKALIKLAEFRRIHNKMTGNLLPIYFPHRMGCSLGGGCWYLVHSMIKNIFPDAVIVRYK